MKLPAQRYTGSWVQFPRFEQADENGTATKIAQQHRWLSPGMTAAIKEPVSARFTGKTIDLKKINNWAGVDHTAREYLTRGERYIAPKELGLARSPYDDKTLFRGRLLVHSSLWDTQAISGRRWEFILESGTLEPRFEEVAAVMIESPHVLTGQDRGQLFVVKNEMEHGKSLTLKLTQQSCKALSAIFILIL